VRLSDETRDADTLSSPEIGVDTVIGLR